MSLYSQYIKERENREIVEKEHGFATYIISGPDCYIADIFVIAEKRQGGLAFEMCREIAEIAVARGCKRILGSVDPSALNATESMKAVLAMGMELLELRGPLIFLGRTI